MQKRENKIVLFLLITSFFLLLTGCTDKESDAYKFKTEYESINGKTNELGYKNRKVKISKKNPIVYKSEDEIIDMINKDYTFVVYFGYASCPWCRSVVKNLISVAKEEGLNKIYYVDISNIRDTYEVINNEVKKTKEASSGYYKLLDIFDDYLEDYKITNSLGKTIDVGVKRIYGPKIFGVIKGEIKSGVTGISKLQTDPYMKLTDEINEESKTIIKEPIKIVVDELNSCDISGC